MSNLKEIEARNIIPFGKSCKTDCFCKFYHYFDVPDLMMCNYIKKEIPDMRNAESWPIFRKICGINE